MSNTRAIQLQYRDRLFIDGEWVQPSSANVHEVIDCSTEENVASVPEALSPGMTRAVAAARDAFDRGPWPRMSADERAAFLEKIAQRFESRNDEFARVWSIESGVVYKVAQPLDRSYT